MNTLCSDLLDSIHNHTNPYQCLLLDREIEDYDIKWFIYNYEHRTTFGNEVLNLAHKQGLTFLELLYRISLEYNVDFDDDSLGWALVRLAFKHRLEYDKIKSIGSMFRCNDHFIMIESIKYSGYHDVDIDAKKIRYDDDYIMMIIHAYQNGDEKIINKVLEKAKEFKYEFGIDILRYIGQKDYINFTIEYDKIRENFRRVDILVNFFYDLAPLVRYGTIDMIKYTLRDQKFWRKTNSGLYVPRLDAEPEFIEHLASIYNIDVAYIAFQVGYDGPCWQELKNKDLRTIDIFDWCTTHYYDNSRILMKPDMLRRVFEADKPSQRELYKLLWLVQKIKRYDIYMYVFGLLED